LFLLETLKKSSEIVCETFKVKFVNFYVYENKSKERDEFHQIKNTFYGYLYIKENNLLEIPNKKVIFHLNKIYLFIFNSF
jgi:hypothetical protein